MIIVTYDSLEEFKKFAELWVDGTTEGRAGRPLSVRISQREYHELSPHGRIITHFVALQARLEDEIHLCKFRGLKYEFLGVRWDFKQCRPEGLRWSKNAYATIVEYCGQEGYRVLPGWIWIKDLGLLAGSKLEDDSLTNPLTVRIEMRGGVAYVEEAPDCVEVIIEDLDGDGSR